MPKFQCSNGHTFVFPLTVTEHTTKGVHTNIDYGRTAEHNVIVEDWIERKFTSCPVENCFSQDISEFVEVEDITSVKSVDLVDVDNWLKLGYKVKELYSKNAVLIKVEAAKPKDYIEEAKEKAALVTNKTEEAIKENQP